MLELAQNQQRWIDGWLGGHSCAEPLSNLLRLMIIAMSIVVVFPYLPGSSSPVFQGVSISVGVLLSVGSTSAVANVVTGIVLTFKRAFKTGDQVRISDTEGTVIEHTTFVTRILTPNNVEVSIPNSRIMSDRVINFSTQVGSSGIMLHTGVTIGNDVPWPKVHELNASTRQPERRVKICPELHANNLDAFHTAGVEITSPHYRAVRDGNETAIAPVMPRLADDPA